MTDGDRGLGPKKNSSRKDPAPKRLDPSPSIEDSTRPQPHTTTSKKNLSHPHTPTLTGHILDICPTFLHHMLDKKHFKRGKI
jgi:hypothetical protein